MGKNDKKTHRKFRRDQTNVTWYKNREPNFGSQVHGRGGREGEGRGGEGRGGEVG